MTVPWTKAVYVLALATDAPTSGQIALQLADDLRDCRFLKERPDCEGPENYPNDPYAGVPVRYQVIAEPNWTIAQYQQQCAADPSTAGAIIVLPPAVQSNSFNVGVSAAWSALSLQAIVSDCEPQNTNYSGGTPYVTFVTHVRTGVGKRFSLSLSALLAGYGAFLAGQKAITDTYTAGSPQPSPSPGATYLSSYTTTKGPTSVSLGIPLLTTASSISIGQGSGSDNSAEIAGAIASLMPKFLEDLMQPCYPVDAANYDEPVWNPDQVYASQCRWFHSPYAPPSWDYQVGVTRPYGSPSPDPRSSQTPGPCDIDAPRVLGFDPGTRRLFAATAHGIVVSTERGEPAFGTTLPTILCGHDIVAMTIVSAMNEGIAAEARGEVWAFDLSSLRPRPIQTFKQNSSAIAYDPLLRKLAIFDRSAKAAFVMGSVARGGLQPIPLGGTPGSSSVSDGRGTVYVNDATSEKIFAVDLKSGKARTLDFDPSCQPPTTMAIDRDGRRLFIVCSQGLDIVDVDTGNVIVRQAIDGPNGVLFNPVSRLIFVSSAKNGVLTILHEDDPDAFSRAEQISTERGIVAMAADPGTGKVFFIGPSTGGGGAFDLITARPCWSVGRRSRGTPVPYCEKKSYLIYGN